MEMLQFPTTETHWQNNTYTIRNLRRWHYGANVNVLTLRSPEKRAPQCYCHCSYTQQYRGGSQAV